MKNNIIVKKFIAFFSLCLIISLIISPKTSVVSAYKGIKLWFDTVFPALFPFFVGVELLNKSGFVRILGIIMEPLIRPIFNIPGCGSFTFIIGLTSGYPMGAKVTTEMRESNLVTKLEGERMLAYCNNSGPLFILGAVGVGMFKIPELGNILLFTHILSCITVAILFRFYGRSKEKHFTKNVNNTKGYWSKLSKEWKTPIEYNDLGILLGQSIKNSLNTIFIIGGFIIFFSVIIAILQQHIFPVLSLIVYKLLGGLIDICIINAIICGFFEITTGTSMAIAISNCSLQIRACTAAFIIGWAGLSVHAQVLSIISNTDLSAKPYLAGKALQSVLAAFYTYIILKLKPEYILKSHTVTLIGSDSQSFLNGLYYNNLITNYYKYSLYFLFICVVLAFIKTNAYPVYKKLF